MRTLAKFIVSLACATALVGPVQAASLTGDSVEVKLSMPNGITGDPTPATLTTSVVVGAGVEVAAGDGSDVGNFMLTNAQAISEFIDFDAFTINLRLLNGDPDNEALLGFGAGAAYLFSDLNIAGKVIVGGSLSDLGGFSNFSTAWLGFNGLDAFSLALDTIELADRGQGIGRFGDLQITLLVRDDDQDPGRVPLPASLLLIGAGLIALRISRR